MSLKFLSSENRRKYNGFIVDVTELEMEKPKDEKSLQRIDGIRAFCKSSAMMRFDKRRKNILWKKETMLEEKRDY